MNGALPGHDTVGPTGHVAQPQPESVPEVCEADLRQALAHHELEVWFQPKIEISSGCLAGAEALLRWRHPRWGVTGPAEILAAATDAGAMTEITRYVLAEALHACSTWRLAGLSLPIAVNVAPGDLADETLPDVVEGLLNDFRLPGELLTLEITETAMLQEPTRSTEVMHRLRQLGVALSADDFGVGYSSLSRLVQLPLSELKIDMGLVLGMHTSSHGADAVRAIVDLGHALGMRVVAEGVEDERSLEDLRRFGCDLAQGYLFARPMAAPDVPGWAAGHGRREPEASAAKPAARPAVGRTVGARVRAGADAVGIPALSSAAACLALYVGWQIFHWGGAQNQTLIGDLAFVPVNGAAILCCWLAADAHRDEPTIRRGWRWMSAAALSYLLGDLAQTWIEVVRHQHLPVFGWSDVVYLGFYPLALAGLLSFPTTRRSRQERFTLALDIAVVTVGAASIIWTSYLEPTLPAGRAVPSADLALLVYPVGDLVLLFGVVSVLLRGCAPGTSGPLRTLVAGLGLYLVADLIYGQMRLHGSYIGGDAVDTGWIAALILFSLGAVAHVRRARLASDPVDPITESSTPNVAGPPYVAVLVGFGLLLFICRHLPFFPVGGIVLAAGLQTALVMVRQVIARRENAQLLGRFHTLARTDDLTGLYNRRHFLELAESVFAAWRRVDRPLTMLMIDIDGFKKINDRFGHETGDQVLRAVADVCRTQLRPDDLVGRYGGDELVALLPDTPAPEAASIAGQLQERLRDLLVQTGVGAQPSTLSIGVAELGDARSLDVLLARAELALYDAKRAGSNCVRSNGRG